MCLFVCGCVSGCLVLCGGVCLCVRAECLLVCPVGALTAPFHPTTGQMFDYTKHESVELVGAVRKSLQISAYVAGRDPGVSNFTKISNTERMDVCNSHTPVHHLPCSDPVARATDYPTHNGMARGRDRTQHP